MPNYPKIFLLPNKERVLENKHPWIFSGALKPPKDLSDGQLVQVISSQGDVLAYGHFFNSSLMVRISSFEQTPSQDFWLKKLYEAKALRDLLNLPNQNTNAFRLIHGESDGFSGLVLDIFANTASLEIENIGFLDVLNLIQDFLIKEYDIKNIFIRENNKKYWLFNKQENILFFENNLKFLINIEKGQKTGYFLDQRDNRFLLRKYAPDREILDTFSYAGGFGLNALESKAKRVVFIEASEEAINICQNNLKINNFNNNFECYKKDVFEYLREINFGAFDLIILDPPAFVKNKNNINQASRGYKDINLLAIKKIRKNSIIFTFSCSHHISQDLFKKIIFAAAKDANREVKIIQELTQGPDHSVSIFCPQNLYLKGLILWIA